MSRTQMLQIQFNDVALGYEKKRVVEGLSLTIHSGDYLGVIGENGVGKSTFIKTLLGLIPPVSGQIQWGGRRCPSGVGYLPQMTAASRNFPAVVKEIVLSGRLGQMGYRPFYSGKDRQLAQNAMEQVGIAGLEKQPFGRLSGGQQQRVLLARALCAASDLLVLDEPVSGLDSESRGAFYTLVKQLNTTLGLSIIMVSHDITAVVQQTTHILHLDRFPRFYGSREDYVKSPVGQAYLAASKRAV
ncbi:MAG: metal ABC transporter ATP-binding protein [Eubacterium aggregans]|uniref:metal ABC transporter ATP-binding protein n=1 Tax=Eubacterium aggregans TaxID=81409 RepID=UPI002B220AF2|nr:metal ABC transporter ATP-binding protein [Eubacterium aggregans]MEA5073822.1 metal ABC transporter ATP-binding protein [Eubacterium aggregans]